MKKKNGFHKGSGSCAEVAIKTGAGLGAVWAYSNSNIHVYIHTALMNNQVLLHSTIQGLRAWVLHVTLDTRKFTLYTRVLVNGHFSENHAC